MAAALATELRIVTLREHAARPPAAGKPLSSALRQELAQLRAAASAKAKPNEGFVDDGQRRARRRRRRGDGDDDRPTSGRSLRNAHRRHRP